MRLKLRNAREKLGFTQDDLAHFLGISRPVYTLFEKGNLTFKNKGKTERIKRLLGLFDLKEKDLKNTHIPKTTRREFKLRKL